MFYPMSCMFLQQKDTVLISDWLPVVISKNTDVDKLMSASRNKTVALIFVYFFYFYDGFPGI